MSKHDSVLTTARRTELNDAAEIVKYVNSSTQELFGSSCKQVGKLQELIEKSILSITLENQKNNKILAQACFNDFPNVYDVDSRDWETWLNKRYDATKNNTLNTLFLHFFASEPSFSIACAREIIKSAFKAVPECHYIIFCVPINTVQDPSLASNFTEMKRNKNQDNSIDHKCTVFVTNRDKYIPVLHIRDSNVHDNDDLIPLLNSYTDLLRATYGDYYVAELIEAQNEHNKCLTAESEGFGIGFMAITTDVNVKLLNECFELRPFHGLCKPHADDLLAPLEEQIEQNSDEPEIKHKLSDAEVIDTETSEFNFSNKNSFIPKYFGKSNAFAIQLFCIEEKYDSRSIDFLPKAFECFPDKDYCLITLPQNVPEFTLLQNFLRITPRNTNKINQELYIFHRAGLVKSLQVREAEHKDSESIYKLIHNIKSRDSILNDLNIFLKSRKDKSGIDLKVYVAQVLNKIVGITVLRQEDNIDYLRSEFNIEDYIMFNNHRRDEHGHINHLALLPIYTYMTKYFIREILRKSSKTCLYYPIYPEYAPEELNEKYSLITAINYMVPVRKRSQIEYNFKKLGTNAPSDLVLKQRHNYELPFSLNHINRKLLLEPKITINMRIVVVGASELGVSFLQSLIFSPHLRFNNLTLVTDNGVPGYLEPDELRDSLFESSMNYNSVDHASISLRSWVNIIYGKMTQIDRRNKNILINSRTVLPYDHLILCTGEQYYYLAPTEQKVYNPFTKQEIKAAKNRPLFERPPWNMFVLNNEQDAENLLVYCEKNKLEKSKDNVVFYGLDLNSLCCMQGLIKYGIDPERIVLISDRNSINQFNNPFVSSKIKEVLTKIGIKIYEEYDIIEWNDNKWKSGDSLKQISLRRAKNEDASSPRNLTLSCCLLLCYLKKDVDYTTFNAVNKCHLVYDGRLVIDNDFHTNDSCIRSAGKMTKFKRSYYVDKWSNACFNQKEIGIDLAYRILKLVDPVLIEQEPEQQQQQEKTDSQRLASNEPDEKVLIELYKKPLVKYGQIPGGYYYLNVTKPGLLITYEEETVEREELVTNTENGYFRIHLNKHKCVQTITCLSKIKFNANNLIKLYGFHEQYLNKLLLKYQQGSIKDFYVYFSDNWCNALYHDRFEELSKEIRDISINPNNGIKSVHDLLSELVDKDLILTKDQKDKVSEHFRNSNTRSLIEKRLLNYLNYNNNHLPMYSKPDLV